MTGLLEFIHELSSFLAQLHELLDLLGAHHTPGEEHEHEHEEDQEHSKSSIAVPWVADDVDTAATDSTLSAKEFLAKHGRSIPKIVEYVKQLRPFVNEVKEFVEKFVPFGEWRTELRARMLCSFLRLRVTLTVCVSLCASALSSLPLQLCNLRPSIAKVSRAT
jgi:hypothetical protein